MRERDPAWDALVRATGANGSYTNGRVGAALKGIRDCAILDEGLTIEELPAEIERRAGLYRRFRPTWELSPTALASHWCRTLQWEERATASDEIFDRYWR